MPPEQRLRISAYVICTDDRDRVLLARWLGPSGPSWTLAGGGLDFGEHPEAGALRELTEETGYTGELESLLGVDVEHFEGVEGADVHAVRIVYRARVTGGDLTYEVDGSTDLAAWVSRAEVADLDAVPLVRRGMTMAQRLGTPLSLALGPDSPHASRPPAPGDDAARRATLFVSAVVRDAGRVLLVRAPGKSDRWRLPTARLTHGAAPHDALSAVLRPVGLTVETVDVVAVTSCVDDTPGRGPDWQVRLVYSGRVVAGELDSGAIERDLRWLTRAELVAADVEPALAALVSVPEPRGDSASGSLR